MEIRKQTQQRSARLQLNGQPLEVAEKFCYLSDTVAGRGVAVDGGLTRKSNP